MIKSAEEGSDPKEWKWKDIKFKNQFLLHDEPQHEHVSMKEKEFTEHPCCAGGGWREIWKEQIK